MDLMWNFHSFEVSKEKTFYMIHFETHSTSISWYLSSYIYRYVCWFNSELSILVLITLSLLPSLFIVFLLIASFCLSCWQFQVLGLWHYLGDYAFGCAMETRFDFVQWLDTDVSLDIMMRLIDPADVVRAGSVSRRWRQFGKLIKLSVFLNNSSCSVAPVVSCPSIFVVACTSTIIFFL